MSRLSPENKASNQAQLFNSEQLLKQHLIDLKLGENLQTYSFTNGVELAPFRKTFSLKFQKLWASALARDLEDNLVIEDSALYPYAPTDRVIILQNDMKEIPVFLSYRDIVAPNDLVGIYLHICLIDEKYQGKGLARTLLEHIIEKSDANFIALTTQNEHMVQALRPFCPQGLLFPVDGNPPDEIKAIANSLVANKTNFDEKTFVRKSVYSNGSPLYGDRLERHTTHKDIRSFFETNINFQEGDAVLIIGILKNETFSK